MSEKTEPIGQSITGNVRMSLLPYIHAQAVHETGNFQSQLARFKNNLFGMKKPSQRAFLGIKDPDSPYMSYSSWNESVRDLLLWMEAVNFPSQVSGSAQYVQELKRRNYFEDNITTYLKGVNSALTALEKEGKTGFKITYL